MLPENHTTKSAEAFFIRGTNYCNYGQYQQAIDNFNEAFRLQPDYIAAYYNRGITYLLQGNNKLGSRDAQKTCTLGNFKLLEVAKGKGDCS